MINTLNASTVIQNVKWIGIGFSFMDQENRGKNHSKGFYSDSFKTESSSACTQFPVFGTCDLLQLPEAAQLLQAQARRVGHGVPAMCQKKVQIRNCAAGEKHRTVLHWSPPHVDIKFFIVGKKREKWINDLLRERRVGHVALVKFSNVFYWL